MTVELNSQDELPFEARVLIEQAESEMGEARSRAERESDELRAGIDQAVLEIRTRGDADLRVIQERGDRTVNGWLRQLVDRLKPMQEAYAREGKLDEALAIRDRIRQMKARLFNVRPDPGNLVNFPPTGEELLFDVTGATDGTVWGTDFYTGDSSLATAAVHAGALRDGERGSVRVTVVHGFNITFAGSLRNNVLSHDYSEYPTAFRLTRA